MKYLVTFIFVIFSFTFSSAGDSPKLPDPPKGYSWQKLSEIKAFFLLPDGWFFRHDHDNRYPDIEAYFISLEEIKEDADTYLTGISIQVNKREYNDDTLALPAYAKQYLSAFAQKSKFIRGWELPPLGAFRGFGVEVTKKFPNGTDLHMVHLAFGSIKTNTFYTVLFETPEQYWKDDQTLAKTILGGYLVDDDL